MFVLTRPSTLTTAALVPTEVERRLEPLAVDIERGDKGATYKIAAGQYSMFAVFYEVSLSQEDAAWVLRTKLSKFLLLPFVIFGVALLLFRTIGPIGIEEMIIAIAVPVALVSLALMESWLRLAIWWHRL